MNYLILTYGKNIEITDLKLFLYNFFLTTFITSIKLSSLIIVPLPFCVISYDLLLKLFLTGLDCGQAVRGVGERMLRLGGGGGGGEGGREMVMTS